MEELNKQELINEYSELLDKATEYMKTNDYKAIEAIINNHKEEELDEHEKDELSKIFSKMEFTDSKWLWALFLGFMMKGDNGYGNILDK